MTQHVSDRRLFLRAFGVGSTGVLVATTAPHWRIAEAAQSTPAGNPVEELVIAEIQRSLIEARVPSRRREAFRGLELALRTIVAARGTEHDAAIKTALRREFARRNVSAIAVELLPHARAHARAALAQAQSIMPGIEPRRDRQIDDVENGLERLRREGLTPAASAVANAIRAGLARPRRPRVGVARVSLAGAPRTGQSEEPTPCERATDAVDHWEVLTAVTCAAALLVPALVPTCAIYGITLGGAVAYKEYVCSEESVYE